MTTQDAVLAKLEDMWTNPRPGAPLLSDPEQDWLEGTWTQGTRQLVEELCARHGKRLRCPTDPQTNLEPGEEPLPGCGYVDVGPCDDEGAFDCPQCGIFFWLEGMDALT